MVYSDEAKIEYAPLYGNIAQYGYYFVDLLVGTPASQRVSVIVDTGSRLVGFPCKGCEHCGKHMDEAFDVAQSGSAVWAGCGAAECPAGAGGCLGGRCAYAENYSEGSRVSGFLFEDSVQVGEPRQGNPPARVRMGCHAAESRLFYSQRANGIMGLAPPSHTAGPPAILEQLFADKQHVRTGIFSLCLAEWGGRLTVGGYNTSFHRGGGEAGITWVRLRPHHYHFVFPVGVAVGAASDGEGTLVAWGQKHFGVTIVDTGTTFTYFPSALYKGILENIAAFCATRDGCGARKSDRPSREGSECWEVLDASQGPASFPSIRVSFDVDSRFDWYPSEYLQERNDNGLWCLTFLENHVFQTVLGISFMLRNDVIFDMAGERLGMARAECPQHWQPPPLHGALAEGHARAAALPQRLYSLDGGLEAELGFGAQMTPQHAAAPAADRQVLREAPAVAGALSLLAAVGLLGAARARSVKRRQPACQEEEVQFLSDPAGGPAGGPGPDADAPVRVDSGDHPAEARRLTAISPDSGER